MSWLSGIGLITCFLIVLTLREARGRGKQWRCPASLPVCDCNKRNLVLYTADCHNRGLSYIPPFDQKFERLNFSGNFLYHLNSKTFNNIRSWPISELFLKLCSIKTITDDTFDDLHLDFIDLSYNHHINISQLEISFRKMKLKGLDLSGIPLGQRTVGFFNTPASLSLVFLRLASCKLTNITKSLFTYLQNLTEIDLSSNNLNVLDLTILPPIPYITIKNIGLSDIPDLNNSVASSIFYLDIGNNFITDVSPFKEHGHMLNHLKDLLIDSNPWDDLPSDTFSSLSSLHTLSLCNTTSKFSSLKGIISSSLKILNISYNNIHPNYSKEFFKHSKNIEKLHMQYTSLRLWNVEYIYNLFYPLCNHLKELHLQNTYFPQIPSKALRCFHRLEILDLSANNISGWSDNENPFGSVHISKRLKLKNNLIEFINKSSFPDSYMNGHFPKYFAFHGNPFSCSCQAHWFREWMKQNYYRLGGPFGTNMACYSPENWKNKSFVEFDPTYEDCFGNDLAVIIAVCLCSACIGLITMTTYLIKYRHSCDKKRYTDMKNV